jgi:Holliday junction resolvase
MNTMITWFGFSQTKIPSMAMTPEAKVKKIVVKQLKELEAYYFFPATGGYGKSGVPDIVGCHKGMFFGIECKAGKNTPTPLQEKNLRDIREASGFDLVVNEENMGKVAELLTAATL